MYCFFFFKQKTAYEVRISDWSSDVCSSDLLLNLFLVAYGGIPRGGSLDVVLENPEHEARFTITVKGRMMRVPAKFAEICSGEPGEAIDAHSKIGRASCRERVCQSV